MKKVRIIATTLALCVSYASFAGNGDGVRPPSKMQSFKCFFGFCDDTVSLRGSGGGKIPPKNLNGNGGGKIPPKPPQANLVTLRGNGGGKIPTKPKR